MSSTKSAFVLSQTMIADPRDFSLEEMYKLACRPPHQDMLTPPQLHSRLSRVIGQARRLLEPQGYKITQGLARHSYRAVKKTFL